MPIPNLSPLWVSLQSLIENDQITELHFEGPQRCSVRTGGALRSVPELTFSSQDDLIAWCNHLLSRCKTNERIDGSTYKIEAGYESERTIARVHIVVPPVSSQVILTIAKRAKYVMSLDDMVEAHTIDPAIRDLLRGAVQGRLNVIVAGGTGAGKTTVLNAMLACCSDEERIGIIEEVPEIMMHQTHVVSLYSRAVPSAIKVLPMETFLGAFAEWAQRRAMVDQTIGDSPFNLQDFVSWFGSTVYQRFAGGRATEDVTLSDLVRESVRMRFDRIVVGEVRGPEVVDLLSAMNTGLPGSFCTLHANSAEDVTSRVQLMAAAHPAHFQPRYISGLIASTIDLIVFMGQPAGGQHRCLEVRAIDNRVTQDGIVSSEPIYRYFPGEGWRKTGQLPVQTQRKLAEYGFSLRL